MAMGNIRILAEGGLVRHTRVRLETPGRQGRQIADVVFWHSLEEPTYHRRAQLLRCSRGVARAFGVSSSFHRRPRHMLGSDVWRHRRREPLGQRGSWQRRTS